MPIIKRTTVSTDVENQIVTGLIASTEYCKLVSRMFDPSYFKVPYASKVSQWALGYFDRYDKAPLTDIKNIYQAEKDNLTPPERDTIETFLMTLSDDFQSNNHLNVPYLVDTTKDYFERRSLENLFERGKDMVIAGKIDRARNLIESHRVTLQETTKRFNPFDVHEIRQFNIENDENVLFKFRGKVGEYLGPFEKSWLISFTAPEKRGKSWVLEEFTFQALTNKLRVLFISLEMNAVTIKKRFYKRLVARPDKRLKSLIYPVMDCYSNQNDSCALKERTNKIKLLDDANLKPLFGDMPEYKVCTECRGKNFNFKPAYWHTKIGNIPELTTKSIEKKADTFKRLYGDNLRIRAFPAFTATPSDILGELEDLEYSEGFIPHVLVVDYIDILGIVSNQLSERGNIDATWKHFKGMASARNFLVATADQSSKVSVDRKSIRATDTSEDKRKNAHVDLKVGINQTTTEKRENVMRLNVLLSRHQQNDPHKQALLLQSLSLGQVILDSEIIYSN